MNSNFDCSLHKSQRCRNSHLATEPAWRTRPWEEPAPAQAQKVQISSNMDNACFFVVTTTVELMPFDDNMVSRKDAPRLCTKLDLGTGSRNNCQSGGGNSRSSNSKSRSSTSNCRTGVLLERVARPFSLLRCA